MRKPRTLKQALLRHRIAVSSAANSWVLTFGTSRVPQLDPTLVRLNTQYARRMRETAVRMVARARKPQLARWLSSKDAFLRAFVLEHLDRGTTA